MPWVGNQIHSYEAFVTWSYYSKTTFPFWRISLRVLSRGYGSVKEQLKELWYCLLEFKKEMSEEC
jgi:hypothetical protein